MTAIDLSRLPAPLVIEPLDFETLFDAYVARFEATWEEARERDPTLPAYDVQNLETDPAVILGQAWSYLRLLDRQRVNDAVKAVLAAFSSNSDLDQLVARQNVARLETAPGVPETDAQLLRRYLLSFGRASAGSADRLSYDALTAVPALIDVRVNGFAIHGRRGEIDVVIAGADGVTTPEQVASVRAAVASASAKPEAIGVFVIPAERIVYTVSQSIFLPVGPDANLVRTEAIARVRAATDERRMIGQRVPRDLIAGAAFGQSIASVNHLSPISDIVTNAYQIPVCTGITITTQVQ